MLKKVNNVSYMMCQFYFKVHRDMLFLNEVLLCNKEGMHEVLMLKDFSDQ